MLEIVPWTDIKEDFTSGLLLGNGASVAVHAGFSYSSLFQAATDHDFITEPVKKVFDSLGENDFEFVLRRLWQAKLVNDALGIAPGQVEEAYQEVRNALISTIRQVHVSYDDATPHLERIYKFMHGFDTVVSLNYDLIVYWAAMYSRETLGNWFKDCFLTGGVFREDWQTVRDPYGAKGSTLFFYPHGNLVLAREGYGLERKIVVGDNIDLLDAIIDFWEKHAAVPIFVSDGTKDQKKFAIRTTEYLERVYHEVIPSLGQNLAVYGWSFPDQDDHILHQISHESAVKRIAVSIHGNNLNLAQIIEDKLTGIGFETENIVFFDSASAGCWNNPLEDEQAEEVG